MPRALNGRLAARMANLDTGHHTLPLDEIDDVTTVNATVIPASLPQRKHGESIGNSRGSDTQRQGETEQQFDRFAMTVPD